MQYVMLALSIMSVLKALRDEGDIDSSLSNALPGLIGFFGKGEVDPAEIEVFKVALKDFVDLLKS